MASEAREQSWRDTLPQHEREFVEHISSMPPGMALGYVYVHLRREIEAARRPMWKTFAQGLGVAVGAALAALGASGQVKP